MDNLVSDYIKNLSIPKAGLNGVNVPGELELKSGLWVTKAGARIFPKGFSYDPGVSEHWEWGVVLSGAFQMEMEGSNIRVPSSHSYIMHPGNKLYARSIEDPFLLWVEFSGPLADIAMKSCYTDNSGLVVAKTTLLQIKSAMKIAQLLHHHTAGYELEVHANLWSLISHVINQTQDIYENTSPGIGKVITYIENNLNKSDFSLNELTKVSGLSPETFRKRFFSEIGDSPLRYIVKSKIKNSKNYLADKSLTIKQIALEVGFEDQYYFSRMFKKYEGLNPTEFRKRFYPELYS